MRVAAIDLGTGATRLLVADVHDGTLHPLHRETRLTRLGEGVDARRRLLPVPIARVRNCLSDYRRTIEELGAERALAVATSAVRDADNGEAFLGEVEWSYGFATRLLSGDEEAELARRGVGELTPRTLLVDIGGGSTELSVDGFRTSLDVGSVRLTERHLHGDPPSDDELAACADAIDALLPQLDVREAVAVSGTPVRLAALDLRLERHDHERVHGHVLDARAIDELTARLAAMTVAERRALPTMEPERAPAIAAGALILREIVRRYRLDGVRVSERDLLDGAALVAAELPAPEEGAAPPGAFTCC
jgi:exopolyphosphatase/guanosine-5'-triphosphate,3'-diphosphate pyrophosphatase